MYETEKALAKVDFVGRFRWNNEDSALLRSRVSEKRLCVHCLSPLPGRAVEQRQETHRLFDYEDEQSGGFPLCDEHASEWVHESGPIKHEWVTQNPEDAWNGIGSAEGHGWSGLWFLFAPEGKYSKDGVWPYEEPEQEQLHDGGMRIGDRTVTPDCECGWVGTETTDLQAAFAERDAHQRENER